ncbi:MAG: response regulator [Propioniciclava sp.]
MTSDARITLAVVDDDSIVRSALATYLTTGGFTVVHQVANGEEAVRAIADEPVDVVLMDVRMPRMDGIQATSILRRRVPSARVIIITSFDDDDALRNAIRAGASGFLLKDTSPAGIVQAVRTVMQGAAAVSPGPLARLVQRTPARQPSTTPGDIGLSPRESGILRLLCDAQTNTEIATSLELSESTVKSHVSAIMTKLDVSSRLKAVVRAYELGLVTRHL